MAEQINPSNGGHEGGRGQIETLQHILSPLFSAFLGVINTYV